MKNKKLAIYIYITILLVSIAYASTFIDNSQADFNDGIYNRTYYNTPGIVQLNATYTTGNYISKVFNAGSPVQWNNISWTQGGYYQQELPNNQQVETSLDGINMGLNVLLFHLNNDSLFGENSTLFYDFSGNGNNGICSGAGCPTLILSGRFGKAYSFDGSNNVVTRNTVSLGSAVTFEVWGKHFAINPRMIWNHPCNAGPTYFDLWFINNGVYLNTGDSYGNPFKYDNGTNFNQADISLNTWHHYVVVLSPVANKALLYLDGVNVANATYKNPTSTTARTLSLGGPTGYRWNGQIDEFAIYNRILSSSEIASRYKRGILKLNLSVRSCDDISCSGESWDDIDDISAQNLNVANNSYFQYKFDFKTDNIIYTPELHNVTISYLIDQFPPQINIVSPLNNIAYYDTWVKANVTLNEPGNCTYSLDSSSYLDMGSVSSTNPYKNITNLTEGLHTIKFNCMDLAGNSNLSELRTFTISLNPSCLNGLKDQDESDIDCGGICGGNCDDTLMCNGNSDCLNNVCESGVCMSCFDGIKNHNESDIDCGGMYCNGCAVGKNCTRVSDCDGATSCSIGVCCSCSDGVQNQGEDLVDCGGSYCNACSYLLYLYDDCGNPANETHLMQGTDFTFLSGINSSLTNAEKTVSYHNDKVIYRYPVDNMHNYQVKVKLLQQTNGGRVENILADSYTLDSSRSVSEYNPSQYIYNIPISSYRNDSVFDLIFEKVSGVNAVCSEIEIWKSTSASSSLLSRSYIFDFNNLSNYIYNSSEIVVENSSAHLLKQVVYGENSTYYDFNPVASDLSYGIYNLKTIFNLSKTYDYYNYSIELKRNGAATGMFQVAVNNISNIIDVTNASTISNSYQVYTVNIPDYMITDNTPEIWTLTKPNILFRMDGTPLNNSYYRTANDNLNNTGWILDNNDYYHIITGYDNVSSGSGIIETNDLIVNNLVRWINITFIDFGNVSYDYSTDSGNSWVNVPLNGNLSNASVASGKIRFKINLTNDAIVYDINVNYYSSTISNCSDGIKNQDETDVDCGGSICSKCSNGKVCLTNSDCQSSLCSGGICRASEGTNAGGGGSSGRYTISPPADAVIEPIVKQPITVEEFIAKSIKKISADELVEVLFDTSVLHSIKIITNTNANNVVFNYRELNEKPNIVPELNNIYRYLEISVENLSRDIISEAIIKFKVEESWLRLNNFNSVALYRYVDGKWNKLKTEKVDEDNKSIYYESYSLGFSYFAIRGEKVEEKLGYVEKPEKIQEHITEMPTLVKKPKNPLWIWVIFTAILVLVITFLVSKQVNFTHNKPNKFSFEISDVPEKNKLLSKLIGKYVFSDEGLYCGNIKEIELDLKKSRIANINIEIRKYSYLYETVKPKIGISLPYKEVKAIGNIVIVKHIDEKFAEKKIKTKI